MAKKEETPINCLRDEKVIVRLIKKKRGSVEDPKSPLYGGMAESSRAVFVVPRLRNGILKDILTTSEKEYLEYILGLEPNALSIYKQTNNYWCDTTPGCVNTVILSKHDTVLNLNDVNDFIRYKILLANDDIICPSLQALEDRPKATYRFVLINEAQETKAIGAKANLKYELYLLYGKYKDNVDVLRCLVEFMEGKRVAPDTKLEQLQRLVTNYIDNDPKRFKELINDDLLEYKALVKKATEKGLVVNRNNLYFLRKDNSPLCEEYEEPRLSSAAKYLANPANQDTRDELIASMK